VKKKMEISINVKWDKEDFDKAKKWVEKNIKVDKEKKEVKK
jgi:hypothetical protein